MEAAMAKERSDKAGTAPDQVQLNPGDEAPRDAPGTGEDVCPECHGSGRVNGRPCQNCGGTGVIVRVIGGA
jgi:RecJ-like exonuclease